MKLLVTIQEQANQKNTAGPKAKDDIITIARRMGYESLLIANPQGKRARLNYLYKAIMGQLRTVYQRHPDQIVFQYSGYNRFISYIALHELRKYNKHVPFYLFVHDVKTLRTNTPDNLKSGNFNRNEIKLFNRYDGLIVHNRQMKAWLRDHGVTVPMISLGIFDYLNPQPINRMTNFDKNVNFAGNLYKPVFLTKLSTKTKFVVYGINPLKYGSSVDYRGSKTPTEIPRFLTENFGLVWDGDSLNECSGIDGNYMRYNNPHKTSLYLSSGIPVITWRKAAIADFITANHVGIVVDSLTNIDAVLSTISKTQYNQMKSNAETIARRLRTGYYTKHALNSLRTIKDKS
ncbi:galactofuranosyltransferase [Ligilactobacillus hohenheimensis]|uniref:galactofuranosyltransferase n=1 Tax=Ligilactobacillus hohenheimensis TaxID=2991832 RepID=UPI0024BBD09E|nr:galactofuranosyltransferase [Ligilactobacillus hohenheimensis]